MTRPIIASALVLFCLLPCVGRADDPPRLRVFYTGHSFHMFVPARVALTAKAAGLNTYQLAGAQGIGGSRVIQHWDKDKGDNPARKALEQGDVDVFTMAPHLKIPDEGIDRFVELGLKHNPKMRFLVQQSWVPFDYLDKRIKDNVERDAAPLDLGRLRADHEKWRGQMEAQVKTINQRAGRDAVFIVPAGDAIVKLRALVADGKAPGITKQSELFTDAIGHGKLPVVILVSYCNYACITGKSPVGLKVKEPAISAELHDLLQRIAWDTVSAYSLSGVRAKSVEAQEPPPIPTSHAKRDIDGWTVHIDDRLLADADKGLGDHALRILANRLYDIKHIVPADKVARLQQVPIWIDKTHGKLRSAQYHPSARRLKANGYAPALARCVHIPVAADFASVNHQRVQPWSVMHELAHAYHDQVLGFDHAEIQTAWARSRDSGKYKSVLHLGGKKTSHYGLVDAKEFFAEMTESYFGHNDFFPFNRAELHEEDPETFALLTKIWGTAPKALPQHLNELNQSHISICVVRAQNASHEPGCVGG